MLGGRVSPSILQRLARHIPQNISTSALLRLTPVNRPKLLSTRLPRRTLTSSSGTIARAYQSPLRCNPTTLRLRRTIRYNSNKPTSGATQVNGDAPVQSLSQRFKELSRRYGYAAVGVYLGLSVLDFPFCFLAVRLIGPERVGELEHTVVDAFWSFISIVVPSMAPEDRSQEDPLAETEARETRSPVAHDKHHETASKLHCNHQNSA